MGFGIKELLVVLVIVILLFGTKKLKNIGSDLGGALKGFRKSIDDGDQDESATAELQQSESASDDVDVDVPVDKRPLVYEECRVNVIKKMVSQE